MEALELVQRIYVAAPGSKGDSARRDYTVVEELHSKANRKLRESLFKVVWEMSVQRRYKVVLMARRFDPAVLLMSVQCAAAGVVPRDLSKGRMWEEDFPALTDTTARIAKAPIRVWVAPHIDIARFGVAMAGASKAGHVSVLCDWCLENAELDEAVDLAAAGGVTFSDANGVVA